MSWYTNLYPPKEDFDYSKYESQEQLKKEMYEVNSYVNNFWTSLCCLATSTPETMFPKSENPLEEVIKLFNELWEQFIKHAFIYEFLFRVQQYWESQTDHDEYLEKHPNGDGYKYNQDLGRDMTDEEYKEYWEKYKAEWKPCIWYNKFQYNNFPEGGVEETEKFINETKAELVMLCTSDPKVCVGGDYDVPFDAVKARLDSMREWLNDNIKDNYFARLCVKYWDTHTEG